ncbi:hypothetical protein FKW77_005052 [Venturia effusa]|uniref:Uncharacterized protein n=1 Tax=Venturia effusa TaxID=50376 RepID=A0A517LCC0_9PEZI|nr:hypothetical protein FKW77_005052 [Venturia effusa]
MSLSGFQPFLSTASFQPVLSFSTPVSSSTLPQVHTFSRRRAEDTRTAYSRRDESRATKVITVKRSSSDGFVEVMVVETKTMTTVLSETTIAEAVNDPLTPSPAWQPLATPPPFELGPALVAVHTPTPEPENPTPIPTPAPPPSPSPAPANNAKPRAGAFDEALGRAHEAPQPTITNVISRPVGSINLAQKGRDKGHRNMARNANLTSPAGTGSSTPSYTTRLPPQAINPDPTITITELGPLATLVTLGLRNEADELEARKDYEGTRTVQVTDPRVTIVHLMDSDADSVPIAEYAFNRLPQASRDRHGFRKRMDGVGRVVDAGAGGVREGGVGVGVVVGVWVGVLLMG